MGGPAERYVPPQSPDQIDLPQKGKEHGHSAEGRDRALGLAEDQPLAGQQSGGFPRNRFVHGIVLHPSVVSRCTGHPKPDIGNQAQMLGDEVSVNLWPARAIRNTVSTFYGDTITGARKNDAFCVVGSNTVTWQS